jgi:hypothetical protein
MPIGSSTDAQQRQVSGLAAAMTVSASRHRHLDEATLEIKTG